jgi:hypothetical protein
MAILGEEWQTCLLDMSINHRVHPPLSICPRAAAFSSKHQLLWFYSPPFHLQEFRMSVPNSSLFEPAEGMAFNTVRAGRQAHPGRQRAKFGPECRREVEAVRRKGACLRCSVLRISVYSICIWIDRMLIDTVLTSWYLHLVPTTSRACTLKECFNIFRMYPNNCFQSKRIWILWDTGVVDLYCKLAH